MSLFKVITKSLSPISAGLHQTTSRSLVSKFSSTTFDAKPVDKDVVIPELSDTLEWLLHSPPPSHQFEESPIMIETYGPADPFH